MTGGQKESPPTMWDAHSGRAEISTFHFHNNGFLNSLFYNNLFFNFRFQFGAISPIFWIGQFFIVDFLCEINALRKGFFTSGFNLCSNNPIGLVDIIADIAFK